MTWGINPGQSVGVDERLPKPADAPTADRAGLGEALEFMGFREGQPIAGTKIDVAFIGSCTNGRLSDLREAARVVAGHRVSPHVRALVVPGSQSVAVAAEREGLDQVFRAGRLRMAWRRMFDVPRDESRSARRPRSLRVFVEPELQGPPGKSDGPDAC